jgi:hypothetical protein
MCKVMNGTAVALCWSWLEYGEPLRMAISVWIKVGRSYSCVLEVFVACPMPRLIPKGSNPVHPGNNIHDTFPTGTWPGTTYACNTSYPVRIQDRTHREDDWWQLSKTVHLCNHAVLYRRQLVTGQRSRWTRLAARAFRVISVVDKIDRREISGFRCCVMETLSLLGCCVA